MFDERKGAERVEYWPVERLVPYARNARIHSDQQVAEISASIARYGFNNPVLVDGTGNIIAGHGRVLAAKRLGLDEVPVVPLEHLTDAERRAYILADNKLAEKATWDEDLLRLELGELRDLDIDLNGLGFADKEIDKLLVEDEDDEEEADADAAPEIPPTPVSQPGDIWVLGRHRLVCGDSTDLASLEAVMAGELANLIVTDPPYGVSFERGKYVGREKAAKGPDPGRIANDDLQGEDLTNFVASALANAYAVAGDAPVYVWSPSLIEGFSILQAVVAAGFKVQSQLIWRKTPFVIGRADYHWQHEVCWYGWKGKSHPWYGGRAESTVWDVPKPRTCDVHPTMKPVKLVERSLRNSSRRGDIVLDPFGGSGTTLMAAERLGRRARLVELEPKYVDVIVRRWQDATKSEAMHEATGLSFAALASVRRGEG